MKEAEIARFLKFYFVVFTVAICGLKNDNG